MKTITLINSNGIPVYKMILDLNGSDFRATLPNGIEIQGIFIEENKGEIHEF